MEFLKDVVTNLVASFLFIFSILILLKPKISVSPFICKGSLPLEPGVLYCFIKIVNRSIFNAYDLRVELHKVQKYPTPPLGMHNTRFTELELVSNQLSHLAAYRPRWLRKEAKHAFRIRTTEPLEDILNDPFQSIRIQVSAKHGLTGLTRVCEQEYSHISQLQEGTFTYGTKFGILK